MYNVLPYIEQQAMHDMGAGCRRRRRTRPISSGIPYRCPCSIARRGARQSPIPGTRPIGGIHGRSMLARMPVAVARRDYAVNGGDILHGPGVIGATAMVGASGRGLSNRSLGRTVQPGRRRRPRFAAATHRARETFARSPRRPPA